MTGAQAFARLRSYLSIAHKQGQSAFRRPPHAPRRPPLDASNRRNHLSSYIGGFIGVMGGALGLIVSILAAPTTFGASLVAVSGTLTLLGGSLAWVDQCAA